MSILTGSRGMRKPPRCCVFFSTLFLDPLFRLRMVAANFLKTSFHRRQPARAVPKAGIQSDSDGRPLRASIAALWSVAALNHRQTNVTDGARLNAGFRFDCPFCEPRR